ncbi:MAG TPA: HAMP domain-containing protein [Gemmatimonas aurantiaca]|uniref:histidine kinase n=2 Tax=Gemmatimonas aurantiaca TaxID=173480 RepID=C1AEF8_GEMAT|nr:ATP-binding protein [Gemmatimonas aurantiaca]BAH40885.1 two-component histidine kinase [Gemmatimonas aurantiaca T-27]HCT59020.1 HAMP domain-containing protein [Gemmatimonas aurantiaca]
MKPVRISILLRLTLWNASVLALVLTVFVVGGWFTLTQVVQERAITAVSESAQVVAGAVRAERRAIAARGEVEEERGATEQAVLRELRVGNLDIFITDEAAQMMAARQPRLPSDAASDGEEEHRVTLPQPVLMLLDAMRAGHDEDMARTLGTESGVAVRQVILADGPARVAMMRVVPEEHDSPEEPTLLVTALMSEAGDRLLLRQVRNTLILAIPAALLASILAGFAIARRSLAPLEAINVRTASITTANLDDRLPVVNPHDELGRLAQIINGLLGRVDLAFRTQRQFVADASHELRTPIAIIRGEADVTLRRTARTEAEYREALSVIQGESIRLTRIVEDLFLLARVDAGGPIATRDAVELPELAVDAVRSVRSLALSQEVTVTCEIEHAAGSAITSGDASLLRRLLINLLDNAIKHTPRGSTVRVVVDRDANDLILRVSDEGPGVPETIRAHVFERFVHGPKVTESSASTGAGLGLAIAQAIAQVHGGQITLAASPAVGATFEVRLPSPSPTGDIA